MRIKAFIILLLLALSNSLYIPNESTLATSTQDNETNRNNAMPLWSPNGEYMVYTSWTGSAMENLEIWLYKSDGTVNKKIEVDEINLALVYTWSPDSSFIIISYKKIDQTTIIYQYSLETEILEKIFELEDNITILSELSISPNSEQLAFTYRDRDGFVLSTLNLSDTSYNIWNNSDIGHRAAIWLSNDIILFSTTYELLTLNIRTGVVDSLIEEDISITEIIKYQEKILLLAGTYEEILQTNIYIFNIETGLVKNITNQNFGVVINANWVDNDNIVFVSVLDNTTNIWMLELESLEVTNLTEDNDDLIINLSFNSNTELIFFDSVNENVISIFSLDMETQEFTNLFD